jgi:two-component system chemotaxis response regulator CheB
MHGFEATRRIMERRPTPIVIVSSSVAGDQVGMTMEALKCGALSAVDKPVAALHPQYDDMARQLCTQLAIMSDVKVVRQRGAPAPARACNCRPAPAGARFRVLGMAASTGGPNALVEILGRLGAAFPLPVLIVQHMPPSFLDGFADWLATMCPMPLEVLRGPKPLENGRVYLAPDARHLVVDRNGAALDHGAPVNLHRPSADVLFRSMARSCGREAIGVLLTGMGEDGARGLLEMRDAGCYTISEDESTAVVYGMPGEAARLGAARESLPLPEIPYRLRQLVERAGEV